MSEDLYRYNGIKKITIGMNQFQHGDIVNMNAQGINRDAVNWGMFEKVEVPEKKEMKKKKIIEEDKNGNSMGSKGSNIKDR